MAILFLIGLILVVVFSLMTLADRSPETEVNTILDNSKTRSEIINKIASNHNFMNEFIEHMQNNQHAMQMMQNNEMMMGSMMQSPGMQTMMNDSVMMNYTIEAIMGNIQGRRLIIGDIMQDEDLMTGLIQMMRKNDFISESCMHSTMKKIGRE